MTKYNVSSSLVRNLAANQPKNEIRTIPSVDGWSGPSDEVVLQPGQWLEIVEFGSPTAWSKATIKN